MRRTLAAGVIAALASTAGCTDLQLGETPFACAGDGRCPQGYRCSADYCIRDDAPPLPNLLHRSNSDIHHAIHADVDRNGVIVCWTRNEDRDSADGAVYASFIGANGQTQPVVRIATFDSRDFDFRATCAPIPHSNGQILVETWAQRNKRAETRLYVWTPSTPNGFTGTTRPFYSEVNPGLSELISLDLRAAVVGDEAWAPVQSQNPPYSTAQHVAPINSVFRLRVGAAELERGYPTRDVLTRETVGSQFMRAIFLDSDDRLAWYSTGFHDRTYAAVPNRRVEADNPVLVPFPIAISDFGHPLASFSDQLAALWHDPLESPSTSSSAVGLSYRLAWVSASSLNVRFGPQLPFNRLDTVRPGAMRIGNYLYLVAAIGHPVEPTRALDGTVVEGGDGGGVLDASVDAGTVPEDAGRADNPMRLYRIPWGASDRIAVTTMRELPRALGNAPVVSAALQPLPDGTSFIVAWVEFLAADSAGHGIRYVLYTQRFPL